jgi:hypothetical protein
MISMFFCKRTPGSPRTGNPKHEVYYIHPAGLVKSYFISPMNNTKNLLSPERGPFLWAKSRGLLWIPLDSPQTARSGDNGFWHYLRNSFMRFSYVLDKKLRSKWYKNLQKGGIIMPRSIFGDDWPAPPRTKRDRQGLLWKKFLRTALLCLTAVLFWLSSGR